ncbi:hypothetical protein ABPG77_000095 [Micractinium sp. CCAP 211/92]
MPVACAPHKDATLAAYPNQAATQYMGLVGSGNDTAGGNGCPAGTHHPALRTYILTIPRFTLVPATSSPGSVGGQHELRVQLADAPPVMPIIINGGPGRGLQQGLLDTLRFLADWAELAAQAPHGITMPGMAVNRQCGGLHHNTTADGTRRFALAGGEEDQEEGNGAPSNAMLLLHGPRKASAVVDVEGLRLEGGQAVITVRWVHRPDTIPENAGCHRSQSTEPEQRHYHHQGTCGYELPPGGGEGQETSGPAETFMASSSGLTIFLKGRLYFPPPKPSPPLPPSPPPSPSPPPPPRTPPPPPVVREASGFTDAAYALHFTGFDGKTFDFKGTSGKWQSLLASTSPGLSLRTKFAPGALNAAVAVMRQVEVKKGGNLVLASVLPPSGAGGVWRLAVTANDRALSGTSTLPGGVFVRVTTFTPEVQGVKARVTIDAGFVRVTLSQRWLVERNQPGDFLNFAVTLVGQTPLQLPVTGLLGPSYARTQVAPCHKRYAHDWSTCPYSHPRDAARRRDPRVHPHTGIACPAMKQEGSCANGDNCQFAHNVFEYWLHPTRYRTQLCNDGEACKRWLCFFAHNLEELRVPECKPWLPPAEGDEAAASEAGDAGSKARPPGLAAADSQQAHEPQVASAASAPRQPPAPLRPSLDMALPSASDAAAHHALSAALKQPQRQQPSGTTAVIDLVLGLLERGDVSPDKSAAILQRLLPPAELGELQERLAGKAQQRPSWGSWGYSDARAYLERCGVPGSRREATAMGTPSGPHLDLDAIFAGTAAPLPQPDARGVRRQAAQQAQHALQDFGQLAALQAASLGAPLHALPDPRASSAAARLLSGAARTDSRTSSLDTGTCTPRLSPVDLAALSPNTCPGSASLDEGDVMGAHAHALPAVHAPPAGEQRMELPGLQALRLPGPSLLGW